MPELNIDIDKHPLVRTVDPEELTRVFEDMACGGLTVRAESDMDDPASQTLEILHEKLARRERSNLWVDVFQKRPDLYIAHGQGRLQVYMTFHDTPGYQVTYFHAVNNYGKFLTFVNIRDIQSLTK